MIRGGWVSGLVIRAGDKRVIAERVMIACELESCERVRGVVRVRGEWFEK